MSTRQGFLIVSEVFNNVIKFPLPKDIAEYWAVTAIGDRISENHLELRVNRGDYTLVTEGGIKSKRGYRAIYGEREGKRLGFRLRVRSQLEDLYLLLVELANYTAGECGELRPIKVLDYCHRHNRIDREQGYRIRTGIFEGEFTNVGGSSTQGFIDCQGKENVTGGRFGSGFNLKFMEVNVLNEYF